MPPSSLARAFACLRACVRVCVCVRACVCVKYAVLCLFVCLSSCAPEMACNGTLSEVMPIGSTGIGDGGGADEKGW